MQHFDGEGSLALTDTAPRSPERKRDGIRRYKDTFFRHRIIALIPLLVLPVVAAGVTRLSGKSSTVTANLWVNANSVQQLGYADPQATPGMNTANALTQLMQTVSFDLRVAKESPLYWQMNVAKPNRDVTIVSDLSKNVKIVAGGAYLVSVSYGTKYPSMGVQLLKSILKEAPGEIGRLNQQQAALSVSFYTHAKTNAESQLAVATKALGDYVRSHGISASQMASQSLFDPKFATLYQAVQSAQVDVNNADQALSKIEPQGAGSAIQVVDPPTVVPPSSSKKTLALYLVIGLVVGVLLSGAFVVVTTARDHSLRYADEVPDLLGLSILATVPYKYGLPSGGGRRGANERETA